VIVKWILAQALSRLFGQGFAADLAGRGVVYLADGVRTSARHEPESVTLSRISPGETYTVIARPRPTRKERKLAASKRAVERRHERAAHPNRSQLRAAKRLAATQRRLDRARPGSRRSARLARRARRRGDRFDHVMRPTKRQLRLARELTAREAELNLERERNFEAARRTRHAGRGRAQVRIYD
jgi:hypothetical protein